MKIIHCSDLHIDCKTKFSAEKRAIFRANLLQGFVDLVEFAEKEGVDAILLCGDIFDDKSPLKRSLKVVQNTILTHQNIKFFYIYGNHDEKLQIFDENPQNFYYFGENFEKVDLNDCVIGGVSYKRNFDLSFYEKLKFDAGKTNILMLHVPIDEDKYSQSLDIKKIFNVDYLALGHIHKRGSGKLLNGGHYCYCGCLRATSFSSLGQTGFELLEIENGRITSKFVPFSNLEYQNIDVDLTNFSTFDEVVGRLKEIFSTLNTSQIVRVTFCGHKNVDLVLDDAVLLDKFGKNVFYLEFVDNSRVAFDLKKIEQEEFSLKAEFVKEVLADGELGDEEKQQICQVGLQLLRGEEVLL